MLNEYIRGYLAALADIMNFANSLDCEFMTSEQVRHKFHTFADTKEPE